MARLGAASLAFLLLTVVLAGCLAGDETTTSSDSKSVRKRAPGVPTYISERLPDPILRCWQADVCNQEMTPDDGRQGNEVTIAVNPRNPKNIVGGAKDYYPADAGECVWDGIYVTHDGGVTTYQDRSFDGSPWRQLSQPDPSKLNYASQFWCTTDPVVYFNTKGTFYYLLMAYQADRITGSKTCKDICPLGALNDWAFNRAVQIVATSNDGGKSFQTFTPILEGTFPVNFHDKGWIAASNDGVIHVMWLSIVAGGNLYFRSTDGGRSFGDPELLAPFGLGGGQGSFVEVGPGREVYASWVSQGGIQMRRSYDDGQTWDAMRKVLNITNRGMPGLSTRDFRAGFPAMATDKNPGSPTAGAIYYVWADGSKSDATDVLFSASFDQGKTFTTPMVLNDDYRADATLEPNNWQFFPVIAVSPLGVIDVSWVDTRLNGRATLLPNNGGSAAKVGQEHQRLDQFHTYSLDGGKTWSANFRVRDAPDEGWDPQICHHQNGLIFIGDYNDIDSSWGAAHPVWPDTRSGKVCDVYTAIIQRPIFPDGYDEEKKDTMLQKLLAEGLIEGDHPFLNR